MRYGNLFIYGLDLLTTRFKSASYGPLDVGRRNYLSKQKFYCNRCQVNFDTQEALTKHLWNEHPTKNPVLILGNRVLTSTRCTIRNQEWSKQISVLNAESIMVNDNEVSLEQLTKLINTATNQFFQIDIVNEGVSKRFELDVKLIDDSDIQNIDLCFYNCFDNAQLTNEGIQTFIKLTSKYTAADEYVDGLVNYLVGLQAKVGRASVISFEEHLEKLNQSYSVLTEFNSPLAMAICDVICFMMNAFSEVASLGPLIQVNSATQFLMTGQHIKPSKDKASSLAQLPIDNATHNIIELINHDLAQYKSVHDVENKINALAKQADFSPADKNKINLLLFWQSHKLGDIKSKEQYSRKLQHWDEIKQVIGQYD